MSLGGWIIAIVVAVSSAVSAVAALISARRAGRVHRDIGTGNGRSIGTTVGSLGARFLPHTPGEPADDDG